VNRLALAATLALASACRDDDPPAVRLVVTSDLVPPAELDAIAVTVVGSRSSERDLLCEPVEHLFPEPDAGTLQLPLQVLVERGDVYTAWIAFRIEGRRAGTTIVSREQVVEWPTAGVLEVEVPLERACLDVPCTPAIEQCIRGTCHGVQRRDIFTDPTLRDPGMPCMENTP